MGTLRADLSEPTSGPQDPSVSGETVEAGDSAPSGSCATAQPPGEIPQLARSRSILDEFDRMLREIGFAGDTSAAKIIYLAMLSRFQNRPVSLVLKGLSSAGKSFTVETVLRFFSKDAYFALTAMSERFLAYSDTPFKHRMLVLYEAEALRGDTASYLVRSLLSESRIRYGISEQTKNGPWKGRLIEKDGPTGLISTTTQIGLHPENETRLFSITLTDSEEQTANILLALAEEDRKEPDLTPWLDLDRWLSEADRTTSIPYATQLAKMTNPAALRLNRDFERTLCLIRAHGFLHQVSRERDSKGRIVCKLDDYRAVWGLVKDIVSEGAGSTVSESVRETVRAVEKIVAEGKEDGRQVEASVLQVANVLGLDKSAASRRVKRALAGGYLINQELGKGKPFRLVPGDTLPEEREILPRPEALESGCTVASGPEGQTGFLSVTNADSNQACSRFGGDDIATVRLLWAPVRRAPI